MRPTLFLSESVTSPPKRCVLQHMVCTAQGASVKRRAACSPCGQCSARNDSQAGCPTSSSTITRTPERLATSPAPVRSSTRRVSPMPERSASVMAPARRACSAPKSAASVAGCVDAGNASSLLKLAFMATPRPLQALNSSASRHAATAFARSASRATTTRPRSGAVHADSGVTNTAALAAAPCNSCRRESVSTVRLYRSAEGPARSAPAREEAPHVALRAAGGGGDAEARGLHRALRLAVPVASAADPHPQRLPAVLHACFEPTRRPHVLEHAQCAPRLQHASHLGETTHGIRHAAEHQPAEHGVEGAVAERQRVRIAPHERHPGRPPPTRDQRSVPGVETDHTDVRIDERQGAPRATTEGGRAA